MATDSTVPRGTPEDYREFVRQMEIAAARESAAARARQWRDVDMETRARIGAGLIDLASRMAKQNGFAKPPLNYPRLPDVQRAARP